MRQWIGIAVLVSLAAGCGDNLTTEQAAEQMARALCDRTSACGFHEIYPDLATCTQRNALLLKSYASLQDSGATASVLRSCADAYAGVCVRGRADLPLACRPRGPRVPSAACTSDWQCQSGYCKFTPPNACGACTDLRKAGGACQLVDDCEQELACIANVCIAFATVGQSCDAMHVCGLGTYCKAGTCAVYGEEGASCDATIKCNVQKDLYCASTMTCTKATIVAEGMSCATSSTEYVLCGSGTSCGPGAVCVGPAPDGASCTQGQRCQPPAGCGPNGVCMVPQLPACN